LEQVLLLLVHLNAALFDGPTVWNAMGVAVSHGAQKCGQKGYSGIVRDYGWYEAKEVARHTAGSERKRRPPAMPCLHHDACVSNISKSDGLLRLKRQAVEVLDRHARRGLDHKLRSNNPILATLSPATPIARTERDKVHEPHSGRHRRLGAGQQRRLARES